MEQMSEKNDTFLLHLHTKYGDNLLVNINCAAMTS